MCFDLIEHMATELSLSQIVRGGTPGESVAQVQ